MQHIEQWAKPDTPHKTAIYEVAALLGFEGKWVRMSAADQRAIMGYPVFGKQAFRVNADGTITVNRQTCFGTDSEAADYSPSRVHSAAFSGLKLSPGMFGPSYA